MNLPAALALLLATLPTAVAGGAPGADAGPAVSSPAVDILAAQAASTAAEPEPAADPVTDSAPAALQPGSFAIDYQLRYGALSATLKLRLDQTDANGNYRITATTKGRGLARLFMSRELLEYADFSFADGLVIPRDYQLDSGKKSGEDTGSILFDWQNLSAASVYEGDSAELQLGNDIYDRISADVVVIMDLRNGRQPRDMRVAEKNQLREYTYTFEAEERIETPAGDFDAVRYLRQRTGSSRATRIWYARDKGFLPVQMEQLKDGKTAVTSTAKFVALNGATAST